MLRTSVVRKTGINQGNSHLRGRSRHLWIFTRLEPSRSESIFLFYVQIHVKMAYKGAAKVQKVMVQPIVSLLYPENQWCDKSSTFQWAIIRIA